MTALGLLRDVTLADLAVAALVTASVQALGLAMVSGARSESPAMTPPRRDWAVAVSVVASPAPAVLVEGTAREGARLKLGGGTGVNPQAKPLTTWSPKKRPVEHSARSRVRREPGEPAATRRQPAELGVASTGASFELEQPEREPAELAVDANEPEGVGPAAWDGPAGPGFPDGEAGGTVVDPLQAHAIRLYRQRIEAWFSLLFRVTGSGLSQEVLQRARVRARVSVDAGRRVVGYAVVVSGVAAVDVAARAALDAAKGRELPPPPENYPGVLQRHLDITFVCSEDRCD